MLSNINSSRNRGDGNLGISEQTSSYFTNNIDNLQLDQQQQINCTNSSSVSNSKGNCMILYNHAIPFAKILVLFY